MSKPVRHFQPSDKNRPRLVSSFSLFRLNFFERQRRFEDAIKRGSNADVVFMVDCTGSMAPYIENTKSQMKKIIETCVEEYENEVGSNVTRLYRQKMPKTL